MKTKHFIIGLCVLVFIVIEMLTIITVLRSRQKENENIDLTQQIQSLEKGDSLVVSNLVYPALFSDLDEQFEYHSDLMLGKKTLKFGFNEYACRSYRATSPGGVLKEFSFESNDKLYHYRVFVYRDIYISTSQADYLAEKMTVIRL